MQFNKISVVRNNVLVPQGYEEIRLVPARISNRQEEKRKQENREPTSVSLLYAYAFQ